MLSLRNWLMAGAALVSVAAATQTNAQAAERRDSDLRVKHVLLLSVDGMHGVDLSRWIASHPSGALATLAQRGTRYSTAYTTAPSDSFPGMIAQVTGATPYSAGVFYDDSYDRTLYAPNNLSNNAGCTGAPGTETQFAENIDRDHTLSDVTGGGVLGEPLTQIDFTALPLRLSGTVCSPVLPHEFIRVNTIFEVIRAHGGYTAWSDKHPAYEILNGPSGRGIADLFTPEINSQQPGAPAGKDNTTSFAGVRNYDSIKVTATLNQIDGLDSTGTSPRPVPAIFGMNFQAVSVGQKLAKGGFGEDTSGLTGGYLDASGTPGTGLTENLSFVDQSIGKMVAELQARGLYDSTLVIVSAKHGQSPIDPKLRQALPDAYGTVLANDGYAFNIADDASLIWLDPKLQQADYAKALADLQANAASLGIDHILTRADLRKIYQDPFTDSRTPDFYVVSKHGVIYTGGTKLSEHGGVADDDRHVAMLVSGAGLAGTVIDQQVYTTQIAPTILRALGLPVRELDAVRIEGTRALPGLFE